MMAVIKFRAEHLDDLVLQDAQRYFHSEFSDPDYGRRIEASQYCFTGIADGKVIGCAGVHEIWANRAMAWALLSQQAGPHFRGIHRAAMGFFSQAPWNRIESQVEDGFAPGHRWAKLLGMEHEGLMRSFSPTGVDFHLYARIKNG